MNIQNFFNRLYKKIKFVLFKYKKRPQIIAAKSNGTSRLIHISAFNYGNAGDILLPIVLQDLFNKKLSIAQWKNIHVSKVVNNKMLKKINQMDALVIGGGGLFLRDTNENDLSGWQWSCGIEELNKIKKPIIMFAVGYNRFRGQKEFKPIFKKHLNVFVEKAKFIGIRNNGSINSLRMYLENEELKNKLVFQPCMTTLTSYIYPNLIDYNQKEDFIAFNCAFDREDKRAINNTKLCEIAQVAKELSKKTVIKYYSHMPTDLKILDYFKELQVPHEVIELNSPIQIIREYSKPKLVIGMRGHAQMIPFGCKTPILSIISHDKLKWFLDDINAPSWGVDILENNFYYRLLSKAQNFYESTSEIQNFIVKQQDILWQITTENLTTMKNYF